MFRLLISKQVCSMGFKYDGKYGPQNCLILGHVLSVSELIILIFITRLEQFYFQSVAWTQSV